MSNKAHVLLANRTEQALLDEKGGILTSAERRERNRLFRAVHNGDFSDAEEDFVPVSKYNIPYCLKNLYLLPNTSERKKDKSIPAHLQDQWEKDRAKKAEYKRARKQAKLEAAADALAAKKVGKKGRKAMLSAAKFDPSITVPERIIDMITVEQQVRRFLSNLGGKQTMVLPPMEKESRKQVHELAIAFNLKSQSKGKGSGRYTTLTKTTRSGYAINEAKVSRIVRRGGGGFMAPSGGGKGRGNVTVPRHKEGDEVGKVCGST